VRILHVIPSIASSEGGPSKAIFVFKKATISSGRSFELATTNFQTEKNTFDSPDIRKFKLNFQFYKVSFPYFMWAFGNIKKYNLIYIHGLFSFLPVITAILCKIYKVPYIVRPLGSLQQYGMENNKPFWKRLSVFCFEKSILRNASYVHFTSDYEKYDALKVQQKLNSIVFPLGVELSNSGKKKNSSKIPLKILFLSRIDKKKNLEVVFEALSVLSKYNHKPILFVAGTGKKGYITELKERAKELRITEQIIWLGHVEDEKKASVFFQADLFILPSYSENFGISVVEALSYGLPCIVTNAVGVSQEIKNQNAGFIVEANPIDIAEIIKTLTNEPQILGESSMAAYNLFNMKYSMSVFEQNLDLLYRKIEVQNVK